MKSIIKTWVLAEVLKLEARTLLNNKVQQSLDPKSYQIHARYIGSSVERRVPIASQNAMLCCAVYCSSLYYSCSSISPSAFHATVLSETSHSSGQHVSVRLSSQLSFPCGSIIGKCCIRRTVQ